MQDKIVLIMAGGAGTRFWPASRESKPKQFLDILGTGKSLLRQTFERCLKFTTADRVFIVTNTAYATQVLTDLPELNADQVFCEPSRNNTAPCIAYASLKLKTRYPDAVCLVAPSDHIIGDEDTFASVVLKGMAYAAEHDALVTLGMTPTRPDTGYGYVQYAPQQSAADIHPVKRFTEKPDLDTAKTFIDSGDYLWNSGMFIWSLKSVLEAFDQHARGITDILSEGMQYYFTSEEAGFLARRYPDTEKISIDYAILERAKNVFVIPASFGWSDLGTWLSLYDHVPTDAKGNVAIHEPIILDNCAGTLVHTSHDKLTVASGLENFIVVNEGNVLLIFPKDQEQEIKRLRELVQEKGFDRFL
jgi:mannose-1-phosphate guanylyltransferase